MRLNPIRYVCAGLLVAAAAIGLVSLRVDQPAGFNPGGNQSLYRAAPKQRSIALIQTTRRGGNRLAVALADCREIGPSGTPWKQYLRNSGSNPNRVYWRTIPSPGAPVACVRASVIVNRPSIGASRIGDTDILLHLSYSGNDYSDSAYLFP
jgi:hypothetical protein